ncbi:MAG: Gfo/Idh/MocA family oxidoreductase [Nanoarchaeota archaeon]
MQKIGIIGINFGKWYIKNINLLKDKAQVVSVCARNQSSYDNLKEKPNNEHIFYNNAFDLINSDVDVVICAVNPNIQKGLAVYALDCNKNLILEKPLAIMYEDSLEIQKAAERTKKNVIVNFPDAYQPQYRKCKEFARFNGVSKFIKIEHGGDGPIRKDYSPLFDWLSHSAYLALDYNNGEMPFEYKIMSVATESMMRNNYSIILKFGNNKIWILGGNAYFDQKVRRFCVYDKIEGVCTYEQFKTEHREQQYTTNPMLNMLTEYIDKLEKKEYFTNLPSAVRTTELLERLEREL